MSNTNPRGPSSVKTTDTVFRILEILRELDGARVSEVAQELGIATSTAHRHLTALKTNEYVVQQGDIYYIGMRFLGLGEYARNRRKIYRIAAPKINQLAEQTGERAEFIVEEYGYALFVHREIGSNAVQADSHLGKRLPLHATSAGKVILAFLPEERVREIIARRGLESYTENTITDEDKLQSELEEIRSKHVAINEQEYIPGLTTVSVPVIGPNEQICGALGISGPSHRLKGERLREEIPDLLLGTANELELKISYP